MKKFFKLLQDIFKGEETADALRLKYQINVPSWSSGNAAGLKSFLSTYDGELLTQHFKKYQIEMNEWANDVSRDNYQHTKERACIAYGVRLAHEHLMRMSMVRDEKRNEEISEEKLDKFFRNRMGLFKT